MFDFILSFMGLGGIGIGIAAWFIGLPKLIEIASNLISIVTPLLKGISEGLVEMVKVLYTGIVDILDNVRTIITVALIGAILFFSGMLSTNPDCEQCIKELRKEYKFVKRKKPYKHSPTNILEDFFGMWK